LPSDGRQALATMTVLLALGGNCSCALTRIWTTTAERTDLLRQVLAESGILRAAPIGGRGRPGGSGHTFSVTVVWGCRAAVAGVTYRPLIALRCAVPVATLAPGALVTVVRGCRAAVAGVTKRPVIALRAWPELDERERLMAVLLPVGSGGPGWTPLLQV